MVDNDVRDCRGRKANSTTLMGHTDLRQLYGIVTTTDLLSIRIYAASACVIQTGYTGRFVPSLELPVVSGEVPAQ